MPINISPVSITEERDLGVFTVATVGALQITPYAVGTPNGQGGYTVINSSLPTIFPAIVTQKGRAGKQIIPNPIVLPPGYTITRTDNMEVRWSHEIEVLEVIEVIEPLFLGSSTLVPRKQTRPINYIEIESSSLPLPYPGEYVGSLGGIINAFVGQILWDTARDVSLDPALTVLTQRVFAKKTVSLSVAAKDIRHPNYRDLVGGYELDNRTVPDNPTITPATTKAVKIKYYKHNKLEPIPDLKSICWMVYDCQLIANQPLTLPIVDCALGTLYCDDANTLNQISLLPNISGKYNWSDLLPSAIPNLFIAWNVLWNNENVNPDNYPIFPQTIKLHKLAANNQLWGSNLSGNSDINFDATHSMFVVDDDRAYNWHVKPVSEGIGDLLMDSPRTIEIHKALQAQNYLVESGTEIKSDPHNLDWHIKNSGGESEKLVEIHKALDAGNYSSNRLDPNKPRITHLGFYIENIAKILGLRFTDDGAIDREKEKTYTRKILNNPTYESDAYCTNSFGLHGRLTPHLTRSNGDRAYDVVYDIPQLLEAMFEHINRSEGTYSGTEIKVLNSVTGKEDYYPNKLALLLDLHSKVTATAQDAKETYNLSFSIAQMVRELFSGIGVPIVYKVLYTRYGAIQYLGHQVDKGSINTSLTTLKLNLGMVLGNMLQSKPNSKLALTRFFKKS